MTNISYHKHFVIGYQLFLISLCLLSVVALNCPRIDEVEGLELTCQDPNTGRSISCNNDMSPGTVAAYQCASHYEPLISDFDHGRMVCQSDGEWNRQVQFEDFGCRIECGRPTAAVSDKTHIVVFGEVASRENIPWHAAIFRSDGPGTPFRYFCGGSLINPSNKGFLIITAAHCVTASLRTHRVRPLEDFRVVLGPVSSDLTLNAYTNGTEIFTVKAAKIHPDYDYDSIQNDVAIMKLNGKITVSNYVSPVCFPNSDMANMRIQGTGTIGGFGKDETGKISSELKFAKLPVVDIQTCNVALRKHLTSIEFCAGYSQGSSICSGDSGGGLAFVDPLSKKLYIQGIASNVDRRPLEQLHYCQNYNTFTRVSSFVNWVQDQLDYFFADDEEKHSQYKRPPRPGSSNKQEFKITVYENINNPDTHVEWRMRGCAYVPEHWNDRKFWLDVHGKCLQFYEGTCSGRSLQLQSTPESSIFEWYFPDYRIKTVSICKRPSGSFPEAPQATKPPNPSPGSRPPRPKPTRPPTSPVFPESPGNVPNNGNDFEKVSLDRHNIYRRKHGVPQLQLDDELNLAAQRYAQVLISRNNLQPSGNGGENLFEIYNSNLGDAGVALKAVNLWYDTIEKYDFQHPSATSFSQLVWKSSRALGVGIARKGRRTVVVAKYSPPGNIYNTGFGDRGKFFKENVFPPRK